MWLRSCVVGRNHSAVSLARRPRTSKLIVLPGAPQPVRKGRGIQKRWIVLAVVVVVAGVFFYQTWQQEQNYQTGHAAYLAADCDAAREPLRKAADGEPGSDESDTALKARAELQECDALLAASQLADGEAVLAYRDFVNKYPASPLVETGRTGAQELLASSSAVATTALCDELQALEQEDFIASPADTLPPLLLACGEAYEADAAFTEALAAYTRFRTEFTDHDLADEVEAAYARTTLAEAEATGAGELPPPIDSGTEGGVAGQATIVIQNDSPDVLAMVFSGPDVRVEEIEACAECEEFFGDEPEFCPELGPIAEYIVEPGTYDVVVKSGSGADVIPFRGSWTLEAGQVYDSCFYIVTSP